MESHKFLLELWDWSRVTFVEELRTMIHACVILLSFVYLLLCNFNSALLVS